MSQELIGIIVAAIALAGIIVTGQWAGSVCCSVAAAVALAGAPMALLSRLLWDRSSERERYEQVVVPFLERFFGEFPVLGYPADAPEPPLEVLVHGWTVEAALDDAFVQTYRPGDPDKVIRFDFPRRSAI